jgi:alkanesulfonate monooxygenase SsuD/methylene tetrahydromethanopterin reductase-like flavin-dependent oxidoreductase (luciferase family)
MGPTEFGIALRADLPPASVAIAAEETGYDYLTCGEHVLFRVPSPNAFIALSAAAAVTQRIRLMSAVTVAPLYPPALLAKMASYLNVVSNGRFDLGVGAGEFEPEFQVCGVPIKQRGIRTDDALEVFSQMSSGSSHSPGGLLSPDGQDLRLSPVNDQEPQIPIWVGGRSSAAMNRAVRYADGWIPYLVTPHQVSDGIAHMDSMRQQISRTSPLQVAVMLQVTIYAEAAKAKRVAAEQASMIFGAENGLRATRYSVIGTGQQIRERVQEYVSAGARMLLVTLLCPKEDWAPMEERWRHEVMAAFR